MFEFEGQQYSLEEITLAAKESKLSVSDYLKKHNIKKLEETVEPVEKLKDVAVKDAAVTSKNPEQASENTELEQVDISSESEDPKPRFIELESGNIIYEDTYLKTKAGQKGDPTTFNEYAKAFGTRPKEFDTDEIVVQATSSFEKLPELKNTWKSRTYNKDKGVFEVNNFNKELFGQEEETAVEIFRNLYKGSGIEFEETDQITESSGETITALTLGIL